MTAFNIRTHWALLKKEAPGLRRALASVDTPANPNWQCVYMPIKQAAAFDAKCDELGIHAADDSAYSHEACRMLCKYEREIA